MTQTQSKYSRFNTPGEAHGISFTCYRNRKFLNNDRTRNYFINAVNTASEKHKFDIWAYVIMPEHVHLLIFPTVQVYSIASILKDIKAPVAKRSISYLKKNKSGILRFMETGLMKPQYRFWQDGGGFDRNISDYREISNLVDYIHNNPVERGLCESSLDWFWSSARDWELDEEGPVKVCKEHFPFG